PRWPAIVAEAKRHCYASEQHLHSDKQAEWRPPFPLSEIAQNCIDRAVLLQKALLPSLEHWQKDPTLRSVDLEPHGVADYKTVFGHQISARYWRKLFARTIERANQNLAILEIYLESHPTTKTPPLPARRHEAL